MIISFKTFVGPSSLIPQINNKLLHVEFKRCPQRTPVSVLMTDSAWFFLGLLGCPHMWHTLSYSCGFNLFFPSASNTHVQDSGKTEFPAFLASLLAPSFSSFGVHVHVSLTRGPHLLMSLSRAPSMVPGREAAK